MQYRPEVDGLRALAVIPVVLFHAGYPLFAGGFVGVDIFFVISGYLITSILIAELNQGSFSIARFYERRARRILPALFFVIIFCAPFAWRWMSPDQLTDFAESVIATVFFSSNILFWQESDYFAPAAELKPLLHTWSLAVEEQYYIFFPLLLALMWRFGLRNTLISIGALSLVSLSLSEWGQRYAAVANFYLAPTRAWELLAGSLCAFVNRDRLLRNAPLANVLSWSGLALILIAALTFGESTPSPSLYLILPVAGVCLILMFASERSSVGNILKLPPLVGVGLISYSLYLWHQPVLAFARIRLPELDQVATLTCILIATMLAYLSWRFIEAPFRDKNLFSRNKIFAISGLLAAFFVLVSGLIILSKGAPARLPAEVVRLLSDFDDVNSRLLGRSCHLMGEVPSQPIQTCSDYLIPGQAPVLLIGDSHLDAVGVFIQRYLYDRGIGSYAVSYSGCIPIKGLYRPDTDNSHACASYNDEMLKFAAQNDVNTIILVSRWSLYILGSRYDNGEGGKEHGKPIYADELHIAREDSRYDDPLRIKRVRDRIKSQVESLSHDYNLAIIGPVPEVGWNVPQYVSKKAMFGKSDMPNTLTEPLTHSYDRFLARNQIINEVLVTLPDDVLIYSPETVLCVASSRRCKMTDQGRPLYYDDNHLSLHGADIIAKDFSSKLYMWGVREQ